jgi:hypothetical protein
MKKLKFTLIAAIIAAFVTSCVKDHDDDLKPVEVKFISGIIPDPETRVNNSRWNSGDSIGIFMIKSKPGTLACDNIMENAANIRYNSIDGVDVASFIDNGVKIYYPQEGERVKFVAYYPYTQPISNDYKYRFNLASQTNQSAIDVLYAPVGSQDYNKTSDAVTLSFIHKLVKLVFVVTNSSDITTTLQNLTVKITRQRPAGSLDLSTGAISAGDEAAIEITAIRNEKDSNDNEVTYEAIVQPE